MKTLKILSVILFITGITAFKAGYFSKPAVVKNFYVSNAGDDSNNGLSPGTAWRTLAKVNASFASINPGDNILLRRGDTFYGSIVLGKSGTAGNLITIADYGSTGAKPVITGLKSLSGWTYVSPGIFKANAAGVKYNVNELLLNGTPQRVGRYPNYDAPESGYLYYNSFFSNVSVNCPGLAATKWIGGKIVIRKSEYVVEEDSAIGQTNGNISYVSFKRSINPGNDGTAIRTPAVPKDTSGCFIQRHIKTLDQVGEWYFNQSTSEMNVYFGTNDPATYTVQVPSVDTLVNINTKSYVAVRNLNLQGAGLAAIYATDTRDIYIANNDMLYNGQKGVFIWATNNVTVVDNNIRWSMTGAIDVSGRYATNVTVRNNSIAQTGTFVGMSSNFNDMDCKSIYVSVANTALIRKNKIDTSGYTAIQFQGNSVYVDSNSINYYCFVKDDGGGIYTFNNKTGTNRFVRYNIIRNGIGAGDGNRGTLHANAVYCDGETAGVTIENNSIENDINQAIYLNDPKDVFARYNTVFNALPWSINKHYDGYISNVVIRNNIFFVGNIPGSGNQFYFNDGIGYNLTTPYYATLSEYLLNMGDIDQNTYSFKNPFAWLHYYRFRTVTPAYLSGYQFSGFQTYATYRIITGLDKNSKLIPTQLAGNQLFLYNDTDADKTISLAAGNWVDVNDVPYSGSATIQPFKSLVLVKDLVPRPSVPSDGKKFLLKKG